MNLRAVLFEIHAGLERESIAHALIGGLALAAHGAARATVDLDLLAAGDRADDIDRLLRERHYECLHRSENVANYASEDAARRHLDLVPAPGRAVRGASRGAPRREAGAARVGGHPTDLAEALDWIEELRELFGDPPADHRVVRGGDYHL